jgi:chromate transporter
MTADTEHAEPSAHRSRSELAELALLFARLGITAFGGPAAHVAMMQDEVVTRRRWLTSAEFLDLLGATNFIPGPNSTEMAIHIGHRRAGWRGLIVAGSCFILPAVLATLAFAWVYVRYGHRPAAESALYGIKPVIVGVVVQAIWGLARSAVKNGKLAVVGIAALVARALDVDELVVLFGSGLLYALLASPRATKAPPGGASNAMMLGAAPVLAGAATSTVSSSGILLLFMKIGSVLFGSGYVLLAFLRTALVHDRHWLTEAQLLDAVAAGQVTPGPVFSTATFVGYLLDGMPGAAAATVGIFLPAFFFVAVSAPFLPRLRQSPAAARVLDGINVASLALMALVTVDLGRAAIVDSWTLLLAVVGVLALLRFKMSSAWLVVGGGLVGYVISSVAR